MAANVNEYSTWFSMTGMDILESKRSVSQFFNRSWTKEFARDFPIGESVQIPFPQQWRSRRGLEYNPNAVNRRHTTVTFEEPIGIDFEYDSFEQTLLMPRSQEKMEHDLIDPAYSQIAAELDYQCATYAAQHCASVVGVLGTNPTTYDATSAAARQIMMELGCPSTGERGVILPPVVMRAVKNSSSTYMNPQIEISKQFRTGVVGTADGALWHESPVLYRHTAGTWAGAVTVATAPVDGATTLALTCGNTDTFKKGDKFSMNAVYPVHPQTRQRFNATAKTFAIVADATATTTSITISISPAIYGPNSQYQNVDALPIATAALTLWPGTSSPNGKTGLIGLYIHENAFALVGKTLPGPKASSVDFVSQKRDPDSGLSVRFIRDWDQQSSKLTNRFDLPFGFGELYNDSCCVAIACG